MAAGAVIPFGAGSFRYIAAADPVPEVQRSESLPGALLPRRCLLVGLGLLFALR